MERQDFNIEYAGDTKAGPDQTSDKPLKQIINEIRDVPKQIIPSISYLPLLDCLCSFDIHSYTINDVEMSTRAC
nr:unnamed protein product [Callosobruchus analis]